MGYIFDFRCSNKVNYREKEKEVLDQILGPGRYDARIRPSGVNGTGEVKLLIFLFVSCLGQRWWS